MRENESFRQRTSRGFNPFTSRAITALNGHANSGPLIHVSKSRYETWLIWAIGLVVTAGIAVINTAPHHRDIAATVIYVTLDCLRVVMEALTQVIPASAGKALAMLNAPAVACPWKPELDRLEGNSDLGEIETLYPRVQ